MIQTILIHRNATGFGFNNRKDVGILLIISLIFQEGNKETENKDEKNNTYKNLMGYNLERPTSTGQMRKTDNDNRN